MSLALFMVASPVSSQVPGLINYQGRIAVGAVNFDGNGQFKFALVDALGATTFWSNDGSSTAGSEPVTAIPLAVAKGLYSVMLGDTSLGAGMTALPATVFSHADVRLRVWFNDGTNGFQLLAPDQRIASVAYALMAGTVADGGVTSAKIATGAVDSTHIAGGSIDASRLVGADIATVGTITSGTWNGTAVAADKGGTGQTSYTNGQLLIGNTSTGGLTKAGLTAGPNITITNGNGSIAIAASGGDGGTGGVEVSSFATGGDGSSASPWTGWDTAITWTGFTRYNFRPGYFAYASSPNFLHAGIQIIGGAGTILKHTGTGVGFKMDAGTGSSWTMNVVVENIILLGNAGTTDGFFLRGVRNGEFRNLSVRGCSEAALRSQACVTNILSNFRCTHHEPNQGGSFAVKPKHGIILEERGTADQATTTWTIINPVIEGVSEEGIWFKTGGGGRIGSYGNTIINGTSEENTGLAKAGVRISGRYNVILNLDSEQNSSGIDFLVEGNNNRFDGCTSTGAGSPTAGFVVTGSLNTIGPGQYQSLTISNVGEAYQNFVCNTGVVQDFTDLGNDTLYLATQSNNRRAKLGIPKIFLSPSAAIDCNTAAEYSAIVTGNLNFSGANAPINAVDRDEISYFLLGSGTFSLTWPASFRGSAAAPIPSAINNNEVIFLKLKYNAFRDKWIAISSTTTST